jgi:hypothetical protein
MSRPELIIWLKVAAKSFAGNTFLQNDAKIEIRAK